MKRPMFKTRICYVDGDNGRTLWNGNKSVGLFYPRRVRVTDARELTPEKAVQRLLTWALEHVSNGKQSLGDMAATVGMTATVKNGKVRVRRVAQRRAAPKQREPRRKPVTIASPAYCRNPSH